jgi:hypothetical protein
MKNRCNNEGATDYDLYGGAGVKVCEEWSADFPAFLAHMGKKPSQAHSIDRWPNASGDYAPGNCRWATATEQARNTSRNRRYLFAGESLTVKEWADKLELPYYSLKSRIADGWSLAEAITKPFRDSTQGKIYDYDGQSKTLSEWSRHLGIGLTTLKYRLDSGWPASAVFTSTKFK